MRYSILLVLLLTIPLSTAATIQGTVYDLSLEPQTNVIVEIDSTPLQRQVIKEGTYEFTLSPGSYTLSVKSNQDETLIEESIEITHDGDYTVDLFTLLDLSEFEEFVEESQTELDLNGETPTYVVWIIGAAVIVGVILFFKRKKIEPETKKQDPLAEKIIKILKENDGRMTQKELRKHFPFSEAKMSLAITELEANKKIKKIKKGRGNIISLS